MAGCGISGQLDGVFFSFFIEQAIIGAAILPLIIPGVS
jgi:hypothetical protein